MKRILALTLMVTLVVLCGNAQAAKHWDDMSWWGNTGATLDPVADSQGRSGYWWWPTQPASNAGDAELWGNRGIVYHSPWEKPAPPAEPEAPVLEPVKAARTIPVLNNVLFDFDKNVLKPEGKAATDQVSGHLKQFGNDTVLIEGHTCSVGDDAYNMGLGQRRADAVDSYLVSTGIDAGRTSTKSFGETSPAVANDTPENRKLNRRAVFQISIVD